MSSPRPKRQADRPSLAGQHPKKRQPLGSNAGKPGRAAHRGDDRDGGGGPPRRGPGRGPQDERGGPPRRPFRRDERSYDDRSGPPRRPFRRDERSGDDRSGPPRRPFRRDERSYDDRSGPPRRPFRRDERSYDDRSGPPRRPFHRDERSYDDRSGPPRRPFHRDERSYDDRSGPPRRPFREATGQPGRRPWEPRDDRSDASGSRPRPDAATDSPPRVGLFRRSADFRDGSSESPALGSSPVTAGERGAPTDAGARMTQVRVQDADAPARSLGEAAHAWFRAKPSRPKKRQRDNQLPGGAPPLGAPVGSLADGGSASSEQSGKAGTAGAGGGHADVNAHAHAHAHAPEPSSLGGHGLAAGEGRGRLLFLDCPSGISGDMTVAALLDLGVPLSVVESAIAALPISGVRLEATRRRDGVLAATQFEVSAPVAHEHRSYADIASMLAAAELAPTVRERAERVFRRLAEAEATVHGVALAEVTFHEVGAVDSIVDIVAAAACLDYLGAELAVSPLPMGRGMVATQHGSLPLPAPATVLCLVGVPTYGVALDGELVTPTGAAIVGALAAEFPRWPAFVPERIGVGMGHHRWPDRPNVVRAVLGRVNAPAPNAAESGDHVLLEANVDDLTGELAGHALEQLLAAGALDAWLAPVTMKKGRPGLVVGALARADDLERIAAAILEQTSSIGVRYHHVDRIAQGRRAVEVTTRFGALPFKVSHGAGALGHAKPEFEACRQAAERHGVPVRDVIDEAIAAYRRDAAHRR